MVPSTAFPATTATFFDDRLMDVTFDLVNTCRVLYFVTSSLKHQLGKRHIQWRVCPVHDNCHRGSWHDFRRFAFVLNADRVSMIPALWQYCGPAQAPLATCTFFVMTKFWDQGAAPASGEGDFSS